MTPHRSLRRLAALSLLATLLLTSGCGNVAIERPYTTEDLARNCIRNGGVWRPFVGEGYCEYPSPGFL